MTPVVLGNSTLYLGDAREILPALERVAAVVTDPPYGVNGGSGTLGAASQKTKYAAAFEDTPEYIAAVIVPALVAALSLAERGIVTPGSPSAFLYPRPADLGILYQPAATGLNKWCRETSQPVLFYGKDPRAGKTIQPKHFTNTFRADDNGHPCPKPIEVMRWMVHRASLDGEIVLDPFMGSGTTGVACMELGRRFVGIECDPKYFEIACRRIEDAQRQGSLLACRP